MLETSFAVCCVVLFSNIGFALFSTGLCRAKNASHTMTLNVMAIAVGTIGFFAIGFGLMCGGMPTFAGPPRMFAPGGWGLWGGQGFFLHGDATQSNVLLTFLLMLTRVNFTVAIPIGALAERWTFRSSVNFTLMLAAVVCPVYGCWVWGGGWLAKLGGPHGCIDYAGASVVHLQGGMIALIASLLIGPRLGKYDARQRPHPILGHHVPMAIAGSLILSVGLLAMNTATAFITPDERFALVAVNSLLAAAGAVTVASLYLSLVHGKFDPTLICNSMIGGFAAIAGSCAFVAPWAAAFIGAIAGLLTIWGIFFFERCGIDDPVGVISMHGLSGAWGVLAVGLFANTRSVSGLFHGDSQRLFYQAIMMAACIAWCLLAGGGAFVLTGLLFGPNRAAHALELAGLDVLEVGVPAYPDFTHPLPSVSRAAADPRPASSPSSASRRRFSVVIEGMDSATLIRVWSSHCHTGHEPPSADFVAVYRHVTTVIGNRFRFSGGEAGQIRDNLVRLFQSQSSSTIAGKIES